jgi:hypothetical protein
MMREIKQREYPWIERLEWGPGRSIPAYAGLEVREWNAQRILETVVATAVSLMIAVAVSARST